MTHLRLHLLPDRFAVCRLEPTAAVPDWAAGSVVSATRTPAELSIVCHDDAVPFAVRAERGFRAFAVEGPLDFALTGILASLAVPLADAGVSIFALSTFDTDWVLVREDALPRALTALQHAGHDVRHA